jgi:hypothetical protein
MPVSPSGGSNNYGIAFLVGAGFVFEVVAAYCSSPQTAEINAGTRAKTLMKWVNIGMVGAAGFVVVAAVIDRKHATAILTGGLLAGGSMYYSYGHAKKAGLASAEPGTED